MSSSDSLFKSSFSSASSLVALQFVSRLFTFVLNQALFRLASPQAYGTIAIQFELMLSTILFISREGVRNTLLRVNKQSPSTSNLSVLPLCFGIPLALATSFFYASSAGSEVRHQHYFNLSIAIYALAAITELMSEPLHNLYVSVFTVLLGDHSSKRACIEQWLNCEQILESGPRVLVLLERLSSRSSCWCTTRGEGRLKEH